MADSKRKSSPVQVRADGGKSSLDVETLRTIVEIVEASEITKLIWQNGDEKLIIRRGAPAPIVHQMAAMPMHQQMMSPVATQVSSASIEVKPTPRPSIAGRVPLETTEKKGHVLTSPFVGTFYRTPAPDQPPFVEVGATVKKGQVLCIVEAMKLMNEIESDVAGRVAEILVQNAQPVEFGQQLFRIEPL